jgi:hypothetical protein
MKCARPTPNGGSAPATPGFNAVAPECSFLKGRPKPPLAIPAAESTLGSHPCVALSSAQVLPEWINRNPAVDHFPSDGYNPLNFVSQPRGSLQNQGFPLRGSKRRISIMEPCTTHNTPGCLSTGAPGARAPHQPPRRGVPRITRKATPISWHLSSPPKTRHLRQTRVH